jgi:hypothetical protein
MDMDVAIKIVNLDERSINLVSVHSLPAKGFSRHQHGARSATADQLWSRIQAGPTLARMQRTSMPACI